MLYAPVSKYPKKGDASFKKDLPKMFYQLIDTRLARRLDKKQTIFDEEEPAVGHGSEIMKYNPLNANSSISQKLAVKIILDIE
jgi:DNA-binding transcriptional regulator PaaX